MPNAQPWVRPFWKGLVIPYNLYEANFEFHRWAVTRGRRREPACKMCLKIFEKNLIFFQFFLLQNRL